MQVRFPYKPYPGQLAVMQCVAKFRIVLAHRRYGKTHHSLCEAILKGLLAMQQGKRDVNIVYICPLFTQAKRVAWKLLKRLSEFLPQECCKYNEAELSLTFTAGRNTFTIMLLGSNNYDALRGMGLYGAILDEFGDMHPAVWDDIIFPMLLDDPDSWALFIGTPKGDNQFKQKYDQAPFTEDWERFHFDINESGRFSKEEIAKIQHQYKHKPETYAREFMLSWDIQQEGSIYLQQVMNAKNSGRVNLKVKYDNRLTVMTVWDLGVADDTTIIWFQQVGDEIRIIDTYCNRGLGLDHYIDYVNKWRDEHGAVYDRHYAPHDIKVREFTSGKSRWETARQLGLVFTICKKLGLEDGINAARQLFPRVWFNEEKTEPLLEALSHYHREFDEKSETYKAKPVHDKHSHFADAFRYLAVAIRPVSKKQGTVSAKSDWSTID